MRSATSTQPFHVEHAPFVLLLVAAVGLGTLGGLVITAAPALAIAGMVTLLVTGFTVALGRRVRAIYLLSMGVILIGYAFYGRPFSYLGSHPVYVGEVVLGIGLIAAGVDGQWRRVFNSPLTWFIGLYALWGVFCTVPYLEAYATDALRDAVIWGYGLFAIVLVACMRTDDVERALSAYRHVVKLLPPAVLCLFALNRAAGDAAPMLPWADVSILHFKPTDAAVHVAGIGAFLLLGIGGTMTKQSRMVCWGFWVSTLAVVMSLTRGGLLALAVALGCAAVLGSSAARRRLLTLGAVTAIAVLVLLPAADYSTDQRTISLQQITQNLTSISGSSTLGDLEGTKYWRMDWWQEIAAYTLYGQHFWQGKGFGINLADDDGFQVQYDRSLRSPHNIHMTVLARMGVPGLLLWTMVLVTFPVSMLAGIRRARGADQEWWARVCVWILAYWLAMVVNASFDVYFEGPAGGIWFWSITGLGIVVLDIARRERRPLPRIRVQTPIRVAS